MQRGGSGDLQCQMLQTDPTGFGQRTEPQLLKSEGTPRLSGGFCRMSSPEARLVDIMEVIQIWLKTASLMVLTRNDRRETGLQLSTREG